MPACMLPCMLQGWLHEPAREEPRTRLVGVGPHARVLDAPRRAAGVLGEARQEGAGEEVPAGCRSGRPGPLDTATGPGAEALPLHQSRVGGNLQDRKSTRLNSSHVAISYAVFCLKKKTTKRTPIAAVSD